MKKRGETLGRPMVLICMLWVGLLLSPTLTLADDLSVYGFVLQSTKRISRTIYEYTYTAQAGNTGTDGYSDVSATVTSTSTHTVVVDNLVSFPNVDAGESVDSIDTFSIQQDRRYPFDWSTLVWAVGGTPQSGSQPVTITGVVVGGTPMVGTVNLKDSSDPPRYSFSGIDLFGFYTIEIDSDWQPPFLLWADGYVGGEYKTMVSYTDLSVGESSKTANITPATTAVVSAAMSSPVGEIDPASAVVPAAADVQAAKAQVQAVLAAFFAVFDLPLSFDLMETPMAVGDGADQMFDTYSFSTDTDNNVVVASKADPDDLLVITDYATPDDGAVLAAGAGDDLTMLAQFENYFNTLYDLYAMGSPTLETLQAVVQPMLADGIVTNGLFGVEDTIALWHAEPHEVAPEGITYVSCSIVRPMQAQFYGLTPVPEMPDNYLQGVWVMMTYYRNGRLQHYLTSFVEVADGAWRVYGNRFPFRSRHHLRARCEKTISPIGSIVYEHGLLFYFSDIGNSAMEHTGLTSLAAFNPAMPAETIGGEAANCLRLARQLGGVSTEFGIVNVPGQFGSQIYYHRDDDAPTDLNLTALSAQETKEFVLIGLNSTGEPVWAWMQLLEALPPEIDALMAQDDVYFASIQAPDNFEDIQVPGTTQLQWSLPSSDDLIPAFSKLAWYNNDWLFQEIYVGTPYYFISGSFTDFTASLQDASAYAPGVRRGRVAVAMRSPTDGSEFRVVREYDPWSQESIAVQGGQLCMDVAKTQTAGMVSDSLYVHLNATQSSVNRIAADVVVNAMDAGGSGAVSRAEVRLIFQPDLYWYYGILTDMFIVSAMIQYEDGNLFAGGYVYNSSNADGSEWYPVPPPTGSYPFFMPVLPGSVHTLAAEYDPGTHVLRISFDGQSSDYDMTGVPGFNPANFRTAQIRIRLLGVDEPGDSAAMSACFDNVVFDGAVYENFDSGIGVNQWWARANE